MTLANWMQCNHEITIEMIILHMMHKNVQETDYLVLHITHITNFPYGMKLEKCPLLKELNIQDLFEMFFKFDAQNVSSILQEVTELIVLRRKSSACPTFFTNHFKIVLGVMYSNLNQHFQVIKLNICRQIHILNYL